MALNVTTSTSLSQNNFHADVAPEVDTGTGNPDTGFSSYPQSLHKISGIISQIMLRPPHSLSAERRIMKDTRPIRNGKLKNYKNISNTFEINYVEKDHSNINLDKWLVICFKLLLWLRNINKYDITQTV